MFSKILIANRGEITLRIARACAALDIRSVAVYSGADRHALHVRACDESYLIGQAPAAESYLRGDRLIEAARRAGCEAVHPGYGFLSENAAFARAVVEAGLVWIGPPPESIELMGSKIESKRLAEKVGVPTVPGYRGADQSPAKLQAEADKIGYPVLIKASAGGGGKGMRVVESRDVMSESLAAAQREALAAFGDSSVLLEKYLAEPRHIEVQVLGDNYGNIIHLGERECSIQRRHQKVVEESPSPAVYAELREQITGAALSIAKAAGYANAGTVEFIFQDGRFYFLEMNTRLQVEHPVTEEATGQDLVEAQIKIAAGEPLPFSQEEIELTRHAVEVRLYAEDPERGFLPSTGKIDIQFADPLPDVRIDAGVTSGDEITPYYDPMIAKIITSSDTRQGALRRMRETLGALEISGVKTNLDFLRWLMSHPQFELGNLSTKFIDKYYRPGAFALVPAEVVIGGAALSSIFPSELLAPEEKLDPWKLSAWRQARQNMRATLLIEGHIYDCTLSNVENDSWHIDATQGETQIHSGIVTLHLAGTASKDLGFADVASCLLLALAGDSRSYSLKYDIGPAPGEFYLTWDSREYLIRNASAISTETLSAQVRLEDRDTLESPMPGRVLKVLVEQGDNVQEEQPLVIIEAMKMEFTVRAPHDGTVARVHHPEGSQVAVGDVLIELLHEDEIESSKRPS